MEEGWKGKRKRDHSRLRPTVVFLATRKAGLGLPTLREICSANFRNMKSRGDATLAFPSSHTMRLHAQHFLNKIDCMQGRYGLFAFSGFAPWFLQTANLSHIGIKRMSTHSYPSVRASAVCPP